ncbi:hypothetical protein JCM10212_007159 [Sporobolomyces blumeae]
MCIVFFGADERYSLILASNRDEFLARPTTPASWHAWQANRSTHSRHPSPTNRVLSGLDLEGGGTWLGIAFPPSSSSRSERRPRTLRIATLTNFTESIDPSDPPRPSRGKLVKDFLDYERGRTVQEYIDHLDQVKHEFAGFNLLVAELSFDDTGSTDEAQPSRATEGPHRTPRATTVQEDLTIGYVSNRETPSKRARILPRLAPDAPVRGLSNATLEADPGDSVWPKVASGCRAVDEAVKESARRGEGDDALVQRLWNCLSTASLSDITDRTHLRHTVLVRPLAFTRASLAVPPVPPPLPAPSLPRSPADLPESVSNGNREGQDGTRWYATRTQTCVLVERGTGRVVVREREAYGLKSEGATPEWKADKGLAGENGFEFRV